MFLDHLLNIIGIDVANNSENCIVWSVVSLEKTSDVFNGSGDYLVKLAVPGV
jgi:hypothetical protein